MDPSASQTSLLKQIKRKPPPSAEFSVRYPPPDPQDPFAPLWALRSRTASTLTGLDDSLFSPVFQGAKDMLPVEVNQSGLPPPLLQAKLESTRTWLQSHRAMSSGPETQDAGYSSDRGSNLMVRQNSKRQIDGSFHPRRRRSQSIPTAFHAMEVTSSCPSPYVYQDIQAYLVQGVGSANSDRSDVSAPSSQTSHDPPPYAIRGRAAPFRPMNFPNFSSESLASATSGAMQRQRRDSKIKRFLKPKSRLSLLSPSPAYVEELREKPPKPSIGSSPLSVFSLTSASGEKDQPNSAPHYQPSRRKSLVLSNAPPTVEYSSDTDMGYHTISETLSSSVKRTSRALPPLPSSRPNTHAMARSLSVLASDATSGLPFDEHALPTREQLVHAAALHVVAESGLRVPFGELWAAQKTVVCFIRHFWCPLCQDYMFSISRTVDPAALREKNVKLVIISNGSHSMIKSYRQIFHTPFAVYTDPGLRVYTALGMTLRSLDSGPESQRGNYVRHGRVSGVAMVVLNAMRVGMPVWEKGGNVTQLGGEFVLGPGMTCAFAHRMRTTRGHAPILRVLAAAGVNASVRPALRGGHVMSEEEQARWMEARRQSLARMRERKMVRRGEGCADGCCDIGGEEENESRSAYATNAESMEKDAGVACSTHADDGTGEVIVVRRVSEVDDVIEEEDEDNEKNAGPEGQDGRALEGVPGPVRTDDELAAMAHTTPSCVTESTGLSDPESSPASLSEDSSITSLEEPGLCGTTKINDEVDVTENKDDWAQYLERASWILGDSPCPDVVPVH